MLREMIVDRITRKMPITTRGTRAESLWRKEDFLAVLFFGVITGKSCSKAGVLISFAIS
jgi:hypothetical protein